MIDDISVYLEDILRNKSMIKEMINTNTMAYEDKIESNKILIQEIKNEINQITSDFQIVENKLKLEYAKSHEQFQKHEINYKLLDKTNTHYKMLIREREEEVRKLEEQIIFACQDYQNKKVKLDCTNVQIVEAEFQLKNLQNLCKEKIEKIKNEYDENIIEEEKNSKIYVAQSSSQINKDETREIDKIIYEKLNYKSSYSENISMASKHNPKSNKSFELSSYKENEMFDAITMNSEHLKKNSCFIF